MVIGEVGMVEEVPEGNYDYDLVVIGGGSGGLSCAKVVWCGVVWCGVVWCGVVWGGVVWCSMVWCGVV